MIALTISLFCCLFMLGCSGRTPDPVLSYMPGDGALSCEELHVEMAKVKQQIALKPAKIKERDARNTGLLGFGFLIYPLFEMDTLNAEETEINALNARYNHLFVIAVEKGCSLGNNKMTIRKPGGKKVTANDILKDDESLKSDPLAIMSR